MNASVKPRPTLAEIKTWPPTVDVASAALALGVSRSALYEAVRSGRCPVESITVGRRTRILTADLIRTLEGSSAAVSDPRKPYALDGA